jgi:hypothetical protein
MDAVRFAATPPPAPLGYALLRLISVILTAQRIRSRRFSGMQTAWLHQFTTHYFILFVIACFLLAAASWLNRDWPHRLKYVAYFLAAPVMALHVSFVFLFVFLPLFLFPKSESWRYGWRERKFWLPDFGSFREILRFSVVPAWGVAALGHAWAANESVWRNVTAFLLLLFYLGLAALAIRLALKESGQRSGSAGLPAEPAA